MRSWIWPWFCATATPIRAWWCIEIGRKSTSPPYSAKRFLLRSSWESLSRVTLPTKLFCRPVSMLIVEVSESVTYNAYRTWIQTLPSCLDGRFSEWLESAGEWRNPACHVRRAGRSGVAYKEEMAEIPLTHQQHAYKHSHGELACLLKYTRDPRWKVTLLNASPIEAERIAADWFDAQVTRDRMMWQE